ncbi:MAG: DUF2520 domain-containing protein [Acidobacteriota bacterium]|nr:DUF2520 domain-containing protein [Acidobacteriota bacterium]MDQ7088843.1 DUF2520 domain-containing protein [Acidobacteriota bacterium]
MTRNPPRRARRRWGIIGAGRAAGALSRALGERARGAGPAVCVWARRVARARALGRLPGVTSTASLDRLLSGCRTVLLAVEDDALEAMTRRLVQAWPTPGPDIVLHLAGARPASALAPIAERGAGTGVFHPVVALAGPTSAPRLKGATATISGDARGLDAARALCRHLGLVPVEIADEDRPLVHLAAVLAAGDLVALLGLAEDLLRRAGVPGDAARRLLASLAQSAVEAMERDGPGAALTGPVVRGDLRTLAAHEQAARGQGPEGRRALEIHRLLGLESARQAARTGRLAPSTLRRLRRLFGGPRLAGPARRP